MSVMILTATTLSSLAVSTAGFYPKCIGSVFGDNSLDVLFAFEFLCWCHHGRHNNFKPIDLSCCLVDTADKLSYTINNNFKTHGVFLTFKKLD